MAINPLLIEITRGNIVESNHRGSFAIIDDQKRVVSSAGDIDRLVYPRSAVKPIQALPLIETEAADSLCLGDHELVLACSSHGAEQSHVGAIIVWLHKAGLLEDDLQCGPEMPTNTTARMQLLAKNVAPGRVHHNCSGKHAGFLTTAKHLGEPSDSYLSLEHPVQKRVRLVMSEMIEEDLDPIDSGIDGCGAPVFGMPLRGLAFAMARYGTGKGLESVRAEAARRFYRSIVRDPFLLAGTAQWATAAIQVGAGRLIVKGGAEGVYCAIVPSRRIGIALKIDDGGSRAAEALMGALLAQHAGLESYQSTRLLQMSLSAITNSQGIVVGQTRLAGAI